MFLWERANFEAISDDISALNEKLTTSSFYFRFENVDSMWNQFRLTLWISMESMEKNIPSRTVTDKHSQPWIDSGVRCALRKKRKLYRKARKSNSDADWSTFRKHGRSLDRRIRNQHRNYLSGTVGASLESNNTKPFWNYIK